MAGQLGLGRLALACFEVHDHQASFGIDLQPVHLSAEDRRPHRGFSVSSRRRFRAGLRVIDDVRQLHFEVPFDADKAPAFAAHDEDVLGQLPDHGFGPLEIQFAFPVVLHAERRPPPDEFCHVFGPRSIRQVLGNGVDQGPQAPREIGGRFPAGSLDEPVKGRLLDGFHLGRRDVTRSLRAAQSAPRKRAAQAPTMNRDGHRERTVRLRQGRQAPWRPRPIRQRTCRPAGRTDGVRPRGRGASAAVPPG